MSPRWSLAQQLAGWTPDIYLQVAHYVQVYLYTDAPIFHFIHAIPHVDHFSQAYEEESSVDDGDAAGSAKDGDGKGDN